MSKSVKLMSGLFITLLFGASLSFADVKPVEFRELKLHMVAYDQPMDVVTYVAPLEIVSSHEARVLVLFPEQDNIPVNVAAIGTFSDKGTLKFSFIVDGENTSLTLLIDWKDDLNLEKPDFEAEITGTLSGNSDTTAVTGTAKFTGRVLELK